MSLRISIKSENKDTFRPIVKDYNKAEVVIGRHSSNDFVLDQEGVSERHARIRTVEGNSDGEKKIFITDLGSASGVSVGTNKIKAYKEVEISADDEVRIADFTLNPSVFGATVKDGVKFFAKGSKGKTGFFSKSQEEHQSLPTKQIKVMSLKGGQEEKDTATSGDSETIELHKLAETAPVNSAPIKPAQESSKSAQGKNGEVSTNANGLNTTAKVKEETTESASTLNSDSAETSQKSGASVTAKVKQHRIVNFDFEATRLVSLQGKVTHHGKALEGVQIDAGPLGTSTTGASGLFSFINISEDTPFKLTAKKDGYILNCQSPEGILDSETNIEFTAIQLLSVSGKVINKGKPIAGVEIDCGKFGKTVTSEDGSYTIRDVPEDTELDIVAKKDGFLFQQSSQASESRAEQK